MKKPKVQYIPVGAWHSMPQEERTRAINSGALICETPASYMSVQDRLARVTRERDDATAARLEAERNLKAEQTRTRCMTDRLDRQEAAIRAQQATITRLRTVAHELVEEIATDGEEAPHDGPVTLQEAIDHINRNGDDRNAFNKALDIAMRKVRGEPVTEKEINDYIRGR